MNPKTTTNGTTMTVDKTHGEEPQSQQSVLGITIICCVKRVFWANLASSKIKIKKVNEWWMS